ncbi:MAG: hypothetical protein J6V13_02845 [Paludibacteraceae bacterium]|nr:hypothetical protein [Paludibacteraceae bacterium]
MVYRFTFISDEDDAFVRIIDVDSEATFFDLHKAIQKSVNFNDEQITSFFLCNDNWEKGQEITLIEMDSSSEYDNLVMDSTRIEEFISEESQKIFYVFDSLFERGFYGELTEIITGKTLAQPQCVQAEGDAPVQMMEVDVLAGMDKTSGFDADFYGDSDYDVDELDEEGFGGMEDFESFQDDSMY